MRSDPPPGGIPLLVIVQYTKRMFACKAAPIHENALGRLREGKVPLE